jgi:hypothetical protein
MKTILIASTIFVSVVLLAGCGDQKQTAADSQAIKPASVTSVPVQEKFESVTTKLSSPAFGSVDSINDVKSPNAGSTIAIKGEKVVISGVFVDAVKGEVAAGVIAMINGKSFVATYGGERPDIAKALNNPKYLKSQFYVEIPKDSIGPGVHDLKIRVIASDKSGYFESDVLAKLDVK